MPSKRHNKWLARRKRTGIEYVLGFFNSYEEAIEAEQNFAKEWPGQKGRPIEHGTNRGFHLHHRRKTYPIDRACLDAHSMYNRRRRARRMYG